MLKHYPVKKKVGPRHGPHHRRRASSTMCPRPAGKPPGVRSVAAVGRCRRCSLGCRSSATSLRPEMDRVFNCGIGFTMIVSHYYAESIRERLTKEGVPTFAIGEVREGEAGVEWMD